MKKTLLAMFATLCLATTALATPSTQVWIPSTDVQAFGVTHLNFDTYVMSEPKAAAESDSGAPTYYYPLYVIGPTIGVLPTKAIQAEIGFDLFSGLGSADAYPLYGHMKLGMPEGTLFPYSPAIAGGGYNFGTEKDVTDQNITYALMAETIPYLGRISAGWYWANDNVVKGDNNGVLLSLDRTLSEISDKLWVAVDYQGGDNALGALNFGVAWAFAPNTSVILGYDVYNDTDFYADNSFTIQVDINYP